VGVGIVGSHSIIEYLKYTAPRFVYSPRLSPQYSAAAMQAVKTLMEAPERVQRLSEMSDFFRGQCRMRGLNIGLGKHAAVVFVIQGD